MLAPIAARLGWTTNSPADPIRESTSLFSEAIFRRLLVLERKRSERSGRPFALVCLDVFRLTDESGRLDPVARDAVVAVLLRAFRETDVAGWYSENRIVSVLLTELGGADRLALRSIIREKLDRCVLSGLPREISARVSGAVYYFPEEHGVEIPKRVREVLYPDLAPARGRPGGAFLKRTMDLAGSLVLLTLLAPLMLWIALSIKLTSPGPAFFRQTRLGRFGRSFEFLKFRSMYIDTDSSVHERYVEAFIKNGRRTTRSRDGRPLFKIVGDLRVTPVGRILRRTSLDELPQLLNVLMGDMSLVGPRPPIPYEVKQYELWHRRRILEVKPGLTGFWQVRGRSRTTFDEMVRMDLLYARKCSPWLDLRLLLETPLAVVRGDGAY
jgi:lipopolysaccharide/colanic/teichoic acid biosynthesis glycosyltransferase